MTSRFIRPSKYRHVYGQPAKKESCIDNVKVSSNAWDTNIIAASAKYISVNWNASGGGAFAILPAPSPWLSSTFPSKLPDILPVCRQHTAPVLDTAWSPFDDNVVASGGEDGKVNIWKVSDSAFEGWGAEKWTPVDFDAVAHIDVSARKVGQLAFHPTAQYVLATTTGEHIIKIWDLGNTDTPRSLLTGHGDTIQSMTFNHTGALMATTCRDRKLRIFDARAGGEAVRVADGHSGIKGARVVWMGDKDNIATTGFSKMSDREVAIWETGSLSSIKRISIDQSAGVIMPYYCDNGILFLAGKGDGNIRYYEWESETLHSLAEHKSTDPQRGMCFLPRRALNVSECEIARAYKLTTSSVEPISFIVPRKADSFQSDIYPPAPAAEPALTAAEFFSGKAASPKLVDLATNSVYTASTPLPTKTTTAAAAVPSISLTPLSAQTPISTPKVQVIAQDMPLSPSPSTTPKEESTANGGVSNNSAFLLTLLLIHPRQPSANDDSVAVGLRQENAVLTQDLREARAQIRELELQIETLRNNAQKAARALMG